MIKFIKSLFHRHNFQPYIIESFDQEIVTTEVDRKGTPKIVKKIQPTNRVRQFVCPTCGHIININLS